MIDPHPVPLPPAVLAPTPGSEEGIAGEVATVSADELPERVRAWRIDGTGSAAWAMAHYAEAERAIQALEAQMVEWYRRLDEWLGHEAAPHRRTMEFFGAHLERFALNMREADPKRKSVVLPSGKVQTTGAAAKVVVVDEPAVIAWADKHAPEAVKRPPKIGLTELRQRVKVETVLTQAEVTNSCGCVVPVRDEEGLSIPDVGTGTECSECGAEALIGQVEPLAWRYVATDDEGCHVPGVEVEEPSVTARVVIE